MDEFGLEEMRGWRWGVFTEYNNADWLKASPQSYFDTFDYTVCGLEDVLGGAKNVDVGAHACVQCGGKSDWDPLLFLHHVATGVSACSGKKPHLNFTANSFYEHGPADPGDLSAFKKQGLIVLDTAKKLGLDTARFGIDEGRLLSGPEGPNAPLTTRAVGTGYQASWDAMFFKALAYSGSPGAYYSRWGVNFANHLFAQPESTVDNVAANVAKLAYKLEGGHLVAVTVTAATNTTFKTTTTVTTAPAPVPKLTSAPPTKKLCTGCDAHSYKPAFCQCGCPGFETKACCCPGGLPHPCIPCAGPSPSPPQLSIVDATVTVHTDTDIDADVDVDTNVDAYMKSAYTPSNITHQHQSQSHTNDTDTGNATASNSTRYHNKERIHVRVVAPKVAVIRALVYHHHPHFNAPSEGVPAIATQLVLCGVKPSVAEQVSGTVTRAGTVHANFWPLWWADQRAANLSQTNGDYTTWSVYSDAPPLASEKARGVLKAGLKAYQAAATLKATDIGVTVSSGCALVELELPPHEVAFVEITGLLLSQEGGPAG